MNIRTCCCALLVLAVCIAISCADEITASGQYFPRSGILCTHSYMEATDEAYAEDRDDLYQRTHHFPKDVRFKSTFYSVVTETKKSGTSSLIHEKYLKSYGEIFGASGSATLSNFMCHYGKPYHDDLADLDAMTFTDKYIVGKSKTRPLALHTTVEIVPDDEVFLQGPIAEYILKSDDQFYPEIYVKLTLPIIDSLFLNQITRLVIDTPGYTRFAGKFDNVLINQAKFKGKLEGTMLSIELDPENKPLISPLHISFPNGYMSGLATAFTLFRVNVEAMDGTIRRDVFYTFTRSKKRFHITTTMMIITICVGGALLLVAGFFLYRYLSKRSKPEVMSLQTDDSTYALLTDQ